MRILLVDDEPLARQELAYLINQQHSHHVIDEANNIKTAQAVLLRNQVDAIFLDMHLQNERGLELMATVNAMEHPPLVVFATAYDDYAIKAFELNATDYILKPFEDERLRVVMQRLEKAQADRQQDTIIEVDEHTVQATLKASHKFLPVEADDRIVMVPLQDIEVIMTEDGDLKIQTRQAEYQFRESLKVVKERLPADYFMQVHRAFIINCNEIAEIQPWFNRTYQVTMNNGSKVIVSRTYMPSFKAAMGLD